MGRRKRNNPRPETEAAASSNVSRSPGMFLLNGSHAPRVITKRNWKQRSMSLSIENEQLKQEVQNLKEELQRYKDEQGRFQQISESAHVQVGDNNIQVVLHQYKDKIEEDAKRMKSMEDEIRRLSTKITDLSETHGKNDQMRLNNAKLTDDLEDLHQLAEPKLASPVCSIAAATDLVKKITPDIMRLQETSQSLNSYIDKLKLEFLKSLCTVQKHLSTLSLNETQLTSGDNRHLCTRKTTSELTLNLHV